MNEVTRIHLGRQAYAVSVDAHKELKTYLDAISAEVKDAEVVNEIELRMAELLAEHGVGPDKVILAPDVKFLKEQLGSPSDFKDEDVEQPHQASTGVSKRLFRDDDGRIIAGVASGIAKYFGVEPLLVRILFIIFVVVTFGWGILAYILLWLVMPLAQTPSDKLRMEGKPVTVGNLKEVVENSEETQRSSNGLADFINGAFKCAVKVMGIVFIVIGLSALLYLIAMTTYYLVNTNVWARYNIFPIGLKENVLLAIALGVAALIALFVVVFGLAMFRRKWPINNWVTGILVGLVFIGLASGGALTGAVYPQVRAAYYANVHTQYRSLKPFSSVYTSGNTPVNVNFDYASTYYASISYYGALNVNKLKLSINNGALTINSSAVPNTRDCSTVCIPNNHNVSVTLYSPNTNELNNGGFPLLQPSAPWGR